MIEDDLGIERLGLFGEFGDLAGADERGGLRRLARLQNAGQYFRARAFGERGQFLERFGGGLGQRRFQLGRALAFEIEPHQDGSLPFRRSRGGNVVSLTQSGSVCRRAYASPPPS